MRLMSSSSTAKQSTDRMAKPAYLSADIVPLRSDSPLIAAPEVVCMASAVSRSTWLPGGWNWNPPTVWPVTSQLRDCQGL